MPDPQSEIIAQWISEEAINNDYKSLRSVINDILISHLPARSEEEVSELAENLEQKVLEDLYNITDQSLGDGIFPRFQIFSDESTSYIKFVDRPEISLLNELCSHSSQDFEFFCKRILEGLGANASVEGGPGDGGIDFVGFGLQINPNSSPSPSGARAVVIGQAKRYTTGINISENELRSFVGAAIKRTYRLKRSNPTQVGALQPIIYAFWTTSDFNHSAKKFAREMGIWYLNGLALTQLAMRIGINHL